MIAGESEIVGEYTTRSKIRQHKKSKRPQRSLALQNQNNSAFTIRTELVNCADSPTDACRGNLREVHRHNARADACDHTDKDAAWRYVNVKQASFSFLLELIT